MLSWQGPGPSCSDTRINRLFLQAFEGTGGFCKVLGYRKEKDVKNSHLNCDGSFLRKPHCSSCPPIHDLVRAGQHEKTYLHPREVKFPDPHLSLNYS